MLEYMQLPDIPPFELGQVAIDDCVFVFGFVNESVRPIFERHQPNHDGYNVATAAFNRATCWLSTITRLTSPADFQAATAGSRALCEIAVDLTLLVGDRNKYPAEKLAAWSESARLKQAEGMVRHAATRPDFEDEDTITLLKAYVAREGAAIQAQRNKFWPNAAGTPSGHPRNRWTGCDLRTDARAADALGGDHLEDFYVGRYGIMNWSTHGSGFASIRGIGAKDFPILMVNAFEDAATLGMQCARLSLQYVHAFDMVAEQRFKASERDRHERKREAFASLVSKHHR
jgi:hypothetical protein